MILRFWVCLLFWFLWSCLTFGSRLWHSGLKSIQEDPYAELQTHAARKTAPTVSVCLSSGQVIHNTGHTYSFWPIITAKHPARSNGLSVSILVLRPVTSFNFRAAIPHPTLSKWKGKLHILFGFENK